MPSGPAQVDTRLRVCVVRHRFAPHANARCRHVSYHFQSGDDTRRGRYAAMARPTLLFVHGAWHGSWCWDLLRRILEERGWTTAAVDLPTVHAPDKARLGMTADADAVRTAIEAFTGEVVVVAHSY